jgi:hypothetical protein
MVQSQPRKIVCKTLSQKTFHKNRAGGVAQGEGPEFKPKYCKKKKKKTTELVQFYLLVSLTQYPTRIKMDKRMCRCQRMGDTNRYLEAEKRKEQKVNSDYPTT